MISRMLWDAGRSIPNDLIAIVLKTLSFLVVGAATLHLYDCAITSSDLGVGKD